MSFLSKVSRPGAKIRVQSWVLPPCRLLRLECTGMLRPKPALLRAQLLGPAPSLRRQADSVPFLCPLGQALPPGHSSTLRLQPLFPGSEAVVRHCPALTAGFRSAACHQGETGPWGLVPGWSLGCRGVEGTEAWPVCIRGTGGRGVPLPAPSLHLWRTVLCSLALPVVLRRPSRSRNVCVSTQVSSVFTCV